VEVFRFSGNLPVLRDKFVKKLKVSVCVAFLGQTAAEPIQSAQCLVSLSL